MFPALLLATAMSVLPPPDAEVWGEMDGETLMVAESQLAAAMAKKHEVTLRISSPGGDGIATLLFIDKINDAKSRQHAHITCVGSVMVASAAAILFESPVCDSRVAEVATVFLWHEVQSGAQGKPDHIEDELILLRALDRGIAEMIGPRMGMTADQYLAWIKNHDRWLVASEAKQRGYVDRLDTCPPPKLPVVEKAPEPPAPAPVAAPPPPLQHGHSLKPLLIPVGTAAGLLLLVAGLNWWAIRVMRVKPKVRVKVKRK